MSMNTIVVDNFMTYTVGIIVFLVGTIVNRQVSVLRRFNIPEPVTGGLIAASITYIIYLTMNTEISFQMEIRDYLLVFFFTAIGLNARFSDLISGGRPMLIMLGLTLLFIVLQDAVGIGTAWGLGLPTGIGVLTGSASLIGGHGTTIAWAPDIAEMGVENAMETGIAAATVGLVLASLIGGPVAKFLISRFHLKSDFEEPVVGVAYENEDTETFDHVDIMSVVLALHVSIVVGWFANEAASAAGLKLPLFVTCLLSAIVLSNIVPMLFPKAKMPARTRSLAIVSDFSLGLFLSMSLMSMQLWTIAKLAGPLVIILGMQTLLAIVFIIFVVFPLMGKDYQAAVLSAGFGGFALGATPTAIANMTAVTKSNGPAPLAFIILPLVAAFFVDVANSFIIRMCLTL